MACSGCEKKRAAAAKKAAQIQMQITPQKETDIFVQSKSKRTVSFGPKYGRKHFGAKFYMDIDDYNQLDTFRLQSLHIIEQENTIEVESGPEDGEQNTEPSSDLPSDPAGGDTEKNTSAKTTKRPRKPKVTTGKTKTGTKPAPKVAEETTEIVEPKEDEE